MNSCLNLFNWSEVKAVLGLLSSALLELELELEAEGVDGPPSDFLIFLALGPDDGLSEYLVQKTHAGHS